MAKEEESNHGKQFPPRKYSNNGVNSTTKSAATPCFCDFGGFY